MTGRSDSYAPGYCRDESHPMLCDHSRWDLSGRRHSSGGRGLQLGGSSGDISEWRMGNYYWWWCYWSRCSCGLPTAWIWHSMCVKKCSSYNTIIIILLKLASCIDGYADRSIHWAVFGEGSGPIHMSYLHCSGTEYKLVDCYYENSTYQQHNEDWSVTCKNGKNAYVRPCQLATHCLFITSALYFLMTFCMSITKQALTQHLILIKKKHIVKGIVTN